MKALSDEDVARMHRNFSGVPPTPEELRESLWPGQTVTEISLDACRELVGRQVTPHRSSGGIEKGDVGLVTAVRLYVHLDVTWETRRSVHQRDVYHLPESETAGMYDGSKLLLALANGQVLGKQKARASAPRICGRLLERDRFGLRCPDHGGDFRAGASTGYCHNLALSDAAPIAGGEA